MPPPGARGLARGLRPLLAFALALALALAGAASHRLWSGAFGGANLCAMTYSRPAYVPFPLANASAAWRAYGVHLYRERSAHARAPELDPARTLAALGAPTAPGAPTAIPAVFFPGNGGSFRQVRSVASETARMHARRVRDRAARAEERLPTPPRARTPLASPPPESLRASESTRGGSGGVSPEPAPAPPPPPALDWFALDFGEELGAFHAASLRRQIAFASAALERILAAYPPGTHVVLLGHSMGGIVLRGVLAARAREKEHARNAPASTSFSREKRAVTAVTLASPHGYSPAATQPAMRRLYAELEASETRGGGAALIERGVALVSVLGGGRDWQVTPETALAARGSKKGFFFPTTFAEDVPGAPPGLSADHQCILWCNQIVRAVATGVLDVAEEEARREAEEAEAEGEERSGEERTAREGGARGVPPRRDGDEKINKKRRDGSAATASASASRRVEALTARLGGGSTTRSDPGASPSSSPRGAKRNDPPPFLDRVARILLRWVPGAAPAGVAGACVRSAAVAFAFDPPPARRTARAATTPRSVAARWGLVSAGASLALCAWACAAEPALGMAVGAGFRLAASRRTRRDGREMEAAAAAAAAATQALAAAALSPALVAWARSAASHGGAVAGMSHPEDVSLALASALPAAWRASARGSGRGGRRRGAFVRGAEASFFGGAAFAAALGARPGRGYLAQHAAAVAALAPGTAAVAGGAFAALGWGAGARGVKEA